MNYFHMFLHIVFSMNDFAIFTCQQPPSHAFQINQQSFSWTICICIGHFSDNLPRSSKLIQNLPPYFLEGHSLLQFFRIPPSPLPPPIYVNQKVTFSPIPLPPPCHWVMTHLPHLIRRLHGVDCIRQQTIRYLIFNNSLTGGTSSSVI